MGGVHPSFMPQEALNHCDAVVIGEVELVIYKLLDDLKQGSMRGTYKSDTPWCRASQETSVATRPLGAQRSI
jgi:radical SAM superfamily enzyme YgiQ (UPF0313 family)